jgi:hypothetical protein
MVSVPTGGKKKKFETKYSGDRRGGGLDQSPRGGEQQDGHEVGQRDGSRVDIEQHRIRERNNYVDGHCGGNADDAQRSRGTHARRSFPKPAVTVHAPQPARD